MTDYRSMYDSDYIGHWDLPQGKDVVVTIERVEARELRVVGKETKKKPVVFFKGKDKGMVVVKTNGKAIAGMYGTETAAWVGKQISLYRTTTQMGRDTVECIRVRPTPPAAAKEVRE